MPSRSLVILLSILVSGCGLSEEPASGVIVVETLTISSPTFEIEPGREMFMCMRVPFLAETDLYVAQSRALQAEGGHHTLLYYTEGDTGIDEAPHECGDQDMSNIRLVGVGTAAGSGITLPAGVAMKLPQGAQLWTQSHYLNTSDEVIVGQDTIELDVIAEADVSQVAGSFVQVDLGLSLMPAATTIRTMECSPPVTMTVPWMLAHMHEYGAHYTIELQRDGEWSTLYESDWTEAMRDDFPLATMDPHITLTPQDRLRTRCEWSNSSSEAIGFPSEMCATFMPYYPSDDGSMWVCDQSGSTFQL